MTNVLTQQQREEIGRIKKLFREDSEFSSLIIARKFDVDTSEFDPYGTGSITYVDTIVKARVIQIDNAYQRMEVVGNLVDTLYKLIVDIDQSSVISNSNEIILNHDFSDSYVVTPSTVSADSVVSVDDYEGNTKYIDYTTTGLIGGDRLVILGKKDLIPNTWEKVFFARVKEAKSGD